MKALHIEIESKLIAPDAAAMRPLRATLHRLCDEVVYQGVEPIRDVYYDTDDWHIDRQGFACRIRRVRNTATLTIKGARRTKELLRIREEFEEELPLPLPRNFADIACPQLGPKLNAIIKGRPLRVLFRVRNHRRTYAVRTADGSELHVSADRFTLISGKRRRTLAEIEVEMMDGDAACVTKLTHQLHDALGFQIGGRSKFREGLRIANLTPPR
jgi:inorganic triphosphatase YgiF